MTEKEKQTIFEEVESKMDQKTNSLLDKWRRNQKEDKK